MEDVLILLSVEDSFICVKMIDENVVSGIVDDDGKLLIGIVVSRGNFLDNSSSQNDLFMRATSNKRMNKYFFFVF